LGIIVLSRGKKKMLGGLKWVQEVESGFSVFFCFGRSDRLLVEGKKNASLLKETRGFFFLNIEGATEKMGVGKKFVGL